MTDTTATLALLTEAGYNVRDVESPRAAFRSCFTNRDANVLTPHTITYFRLKRNPAVVVEVSAGDFLNNPIYGVTCVNVANNESLYDISRAAFDPDDVLKAVQAAEEHFT
jgi:hypothetical protein